jgi:hypothetical protein
MNNKYDVNNFSKIIDEYNNEDELQSIRVHLGRNVEFQIPKFEFVMYESKYYNNNIIQNESLTPPKERISLYTNT